MVTMKTKEQEDEAPEERVPHLPWMRHPVDIDSFSGCPVTSLPRLDPRLAEALQGMGIESFFPVQVSTWLETIGPGAFHRDICINSPTGSGKTLAYALPIVQMLSTRKVKEVFDAIAPVVGLTVASAVGQSSIADEISDLIKKSKQELYPSLDDEYVEMEPQTKVDILVATPGRLMDHINMTKGFSLEHLQYLVVDETDRMLREAYQSWLPAVIQFTCPTKQDHFRHDTAGRTLLHPLTTIRRSGVERGFKDKCYPRLAKIVCSATLTQDPSKLSQLELHHPLLLNSGKKRYRIPEKLESYKLICTSNIKPLCLIVLLQELCGEKCLVFTKSVDDSHRLSTLLGFFEDLRFKFSEFSSLQRESTRRKTLAAFKEGKIDVLIGSDIMARGIHIDGLRYVINYEMPQYVKTYIHRAGRTARAGESGSCFTFLRKNERRPPEAPVHSGRLKHADNVKRGRGRPNLTWEESVKRDLKDWSITKELAMDRGAWKLAIQVKRFDKMLKKADGSSCILRSLPDDSIETLRPVFETALEKLKDKLKGSAEPEASKKSNKSGDKAPGALKRKRGKQT